MRLPFSNYMLECNPPVSESIVTMNRGYTGKGALYVYDDVVRAPVAQGLVVILDDHTSGRRVGAGIRE